jgi:hypothetical protein
MLGAQWQFEVLLKGMGKNRPSKLSGKDLDPRNAV